MVRSQDISSIIRLIARANILSPAEYIKRTIGTLMFTYYTYVDNLHSHPKDLDELIDGLLYLDAKAFSQKRAVEGK
jgi:hypothetical protein